MSELVQIQLHAGWRGPTGIQDALRVRALKRPKEVVELVEALSRMFGRIGMHRVCGACFGGLTLPDFKTGKYTVHHTWRERGWGCCGHCNLLGHSACIAKPLGCAAWMCDYVGRLWPKTHKFLLEIFYIRAYRAVTHFHDAGLETESRAKYSPELLKHLRVLRHAIDQWHEEPVAKIKLPRPKRAA